MSSTDRVRRQKKLALMNQRLSLTVCGAACRKKKKEERRKNNKEKRTIKESASRTISKIIAEGDTFEAEDCLSPR